ncbi:MAG: hypothetical protein U0269_30750 [Polyangiales bacterium]
MDTIAVAVGRERSLRERAAREALAALSWRAGIDPDGPCDKALRDTTSRPRVDVRATAAVYLLASRRLSHRPAPKNSASALLRLSNDAPALDPRAVARVLLDVDRVEVRSDAEDAAFVLGFACMDKPRCMLGETTLRAIQTLSHVDSVVRALRGETDSSPCYVALSGSVGGSRFDLATSRLRRSACAWAINSVTRATAARPR